MSRTSGRRSPTRETASQHTAVGASRVSSPSQPLTTVSNQPPTVGPHPTPCKARAATYAAASSPIAHTTTARKLTRLPIGTSRSAPGNRGFLGNLGPACRRSQRHPCPVVARRPPAGSRRPAAAHPGGEQTSEAATENDE